MKVLIKKIIIIITMSLDFRIRVGTIYNAVFSLSGHTVKHTKLVVIQRALEL